MVEEKAIPCFSHDKSGLVAQNVFNVQGMEHTDERSVILLTVPNRSDDEGETPPTTATGEGYNLVRLIDDSAREEESKEETAVTGDASNTYPFATNSVESDQTKLVVQEWSAEQESDPNMPHCHRSVYAQSVSLNNRFYVFQNLSPENSRAIKVFDPCLRRSFQIPLLGRENAIKEVRLNYSISHMQNKVYLYGGLNDKN